VGRIDVPYPVGIDPAGSRGTPLTRDYSRLESTAFSREAMAVSALVVGAGALGNEVIKNLALLGVRRLLIADRDRVEASNLTRSVLFCTPDIGEHLAKGTPKAEFAARRVREINPDVDVSWYVGEIADMGYGVLRRVDLVYSCLDNEMARLELSWACVRLDKILAEGGLGLSNSSSGLVSLFPGRRGPCYACRKGAARRRDLLQDLYGREDPCGRKEAALAELGAVATTPLMASVVSAFQVEFGLRGHIDRGPAELGRSCQITIHPEPGLRSFTFGRSESCPLHDDESVATAVDERPDRTSEHWTVADMLSECGRGDGTLVLDWPMTARASCRGCGRQWEPLVRRARFRHERCPTCGGDDVAETEVLTSIDAQSPWATRTLAGLGLPAGHVHEIASSGGGHDHRAHVEITGDLPMATSGFD
jgi:molybdopterin/thiamine biosynthesis adenylyltransferase